LTGAGSEFRDNPAVNPAAVVLEHYADLVRVVLVVLFVVLCYQFEWSAWRTFIRDVFVSLSRGLGIPLHPVSSDSFVLKAHLYRFVIACTALDVFFGSIPLLWERDKHILINIRLLTIYFLSLMMANLFRLEIGLPLFLFGVPWELSHEVMAGFFYFIVFLWIARRRGWTLLASRTQPAH
jgi:hypothetical protein